MKNKLATWEVQLVPIGIPTTCLYNLVPNRIKMLSNKKISASHTTQCFNSNYQRLSSVLVSTFQLKVYTAFDMQANLVYCNEYLLSNHNY